MGSRIECRVCREAAAKAAANAGRGGEIRGDVGRYGEMWGGMGEAPVGHQREMWGDMGRYGEMWGDTGRCGEVWERRP